jgi:wyosine [tRNA(Phe)-imidazoG37] synthetase (radical SAM superfamily)
LGRSLGVDLVPYKTCTYDCIYCQLGRTTVKTMDRREYVPTNEVLSELDQRLAEGAAPDYVTLSGSGEPTLHSKLGEIAAAVKRMTSIPLAVLTNGSLLWDPAVREDLAQADLVVPSLDAGDSTLFQTVNRPHPTLLFERMLDGLRMFRKEFKQQIWLEILLLEGLTGSQAEAEKIARLAEETSPDKIELNTVTRPPAEDFALPVPLQQLQRLKNLFGAHAEVIGDANIPEPMARNAVMTEEILNLLDRRPCTINDLAQGLGTTPSEILKAMDPLLDRNCVAAINTGGRQYYRRISGRGEA